MNKLKSSAKEINRLLNKFKAWLIAIADLPLQQARKRAEIKKLARAVVAVQDEESEVVITVKRMLLEWNPKHYNNIDEEIRYTSDSTFLEAYYEYKEKHQ
jgi:hypothetical protein